MMMSRMMMMMMGIHHDGVSNLCIGDDHVHVDDDDNDDDNF